MTTAFAASDVVEGVGDVKAAVTKEGLDKRSYNPIRDDVFGGNELAYALTGTGISLVTDIVTGAVIAKIPERISASMASKSAKRAAKKAAQDAAKAVRAAEKAEQATKVVKVAKTAETVEKTEEAAKAVSAAERFYGELDALKLKAREIPHTLTAEEVHACEAVKLQMKGGLSAAGEVSVEEIEKIDEAVKAANVYKESKEFVGAKKETEFIVKTFDLDELTRSQRKAVELADNIITDHLKESDFFAALGDLQGNPIPKPNGGFWNHAQELRDSYTGLIRSYKTLQGSLQNPNLTLKVRRFLEYKLVVISDYANRIEILFAPYGGIT